MAHFHSAEEVDGGGQIGMRLLRSTAPGRQHAKTQEAVGQERCHAKFYSPSQSLSVGKLSRIEG